MVSKSIRVTIFVLAAFAESSRELTAAPQGISDDFVIMLVRSTCFGECPAYAVSIDAKGNVTYEGKKFVTSRRTRSVCSLRTHRSSKTSTP